MTEPWEDALGTLSDTELSMMMEYDSLLSLLPAEMIQAVADKFFAWRAQRTEAVATLRSTIEGLTAEREQLTRMRDMLAVMGADFADEVLGGSGATPEDWLAEAERRLMKLDALCAAPDDLPTDDERMNAANEAFALGEADCAAPEGSEG